MTVDLESIEKIISQLGRDSAVYFPERRVEEIQLEETIPRPYSQLARIRISLSDGVERAYIKLYRHPRLPDEHNRSSAVREHDAHATLYRTFQSVNGCGVVRPIAVFPELGGWVMDAVVGPTLGEKLHRQGHRLAGKVAQADLMSAVTLAGSWLHHLHRRIRRDEPVTVGESGVLEEISGLLARSRGLDDSDRTRAAAYAEALARQLGSERLDVVGQHGECYAPHHIFVTTDRLLVFDITGIKYGPIYEDLSNLWVGLEALRKYPVFSEQVVRRLQDAFLDGYAAEAPVHGPALSLWELKNMLELSDSWGRAADAGWRGRVRLSIGRRFIGRWLAGRPEGPG